VSWSIDSLQICAHGAAPGKYNKLRDVERGVANYRLNDSVTLKIGWGLKTLQCKVLFF
jgi:hypothetical protein